MTLLATSIFLVRAPPARATEALPPQFGKAFELYLGGKGQAARRLLESAVEHPAALSEPGLRLTLLRQLLDICLRNGDSRCVGRYAPEFGRVADLTRAAENAAGRARLAQEASFYDDEARARSGADPRVILSGAAWKKEIAYDGDLYLRRQVLASHLHLQAGDAEGLDRSLNKILSLIASLRNPQVARLTIATTLADAIATLLAAHQTERAWGLYKASGADVANSLAPATLDAALYLMTAAKLHEAVGDPAGARIAWTSAIQTLGVLELDEGLRRTLLGRATAAKAMLDVTAGDLAAARATLALNPFAPLYAAPGRAPQNVDEADYLAARAFVSAVGGAGDSVAATALRKPIAFVADEATLAKAEIRRVAGLAMAVPAGPERAERLKTLGRLIQADARAEDAKGGLDRTDSQSGVLIAMALAQADAAQSGDDMAAAFALAQLMGRTGTSFDADALAALAQAGDALQRRTIQQALRLRARRDRMERERVQKVVKAMSAAPAAAGRLEHDYAERRLLRDYDERLAEAERRLASDGLSIRGPRLVSLDRFQASLAPDEAALVVAPTFSGLVYICVRRDRTFSAVRPVDARRMTADGKILQASLTAGHAPSEALDVQFPAEAAIRLYDSLIRPFEPCLKADDRLVWLGATAALPAPLSVLLSSKPPRLGIGYDLAAADWLVRRHAVSYAGSAAAVVASRTSTPIRADFEFLGVGDPALDGRTASGELRRDVVLRGVRPGGRFEGLAPLPETRRELEASARGFRNAELLLDEQATERKVRTRLLGDYRYLSFATHGLLRDDLQGLAEPALVLTPGASTTETDDGLLTASEIADLSLRASFVALSACNTANFDFGAMARDLPALASAFAVSGVPATLGTLWPVESQTGEAVVSGLFARLQRDGLAPADALAAAQRAFLAAPPGRPQLHPRFWGPFVVLGDGTRAPPPPAAASMELRAVELVPGGGEVLGLAASPHGVAAWFIADPAVTGGGIGEGLRLAERTEAWRAVDHDAAPSRVLAQLGVSLVAGSYVRLADGRLAPRLQAYDAAGRAAKSWRGEGLSKSDAGFLAAVPDGPASLLAVVGERKRPTDPPAPAVRLRVFRVNENLAPVPLFEAVAPLGAAVSSATVTPLGDQFLLTYTASNRRADPSPPGLETYAPMACALNQTTWVELRDSAGKVLKAQRLENVAVVAAVAGRDGGATVAGYRREGCEGERQALVLAMTPELAVRTLYLDASLGASEVRALAPLADGRILVAAHKQSVTDYAPPGAGHPLFFGVNFATLLLTLDADGRPLAPKLIDAGANVLPTAALVREDGEVLLGGAIGEQAAILHLTVR